MEGHGPSKVARLLKAEGHEVRAGTISEWARRAGVVDTHRQAQRAGVEAARLSNEVKRELVADETLDLALDTVRKAKATDKARERRDHAGTLAIAIDKFELLSGRATSRSEVGSVDDARGTIRRVAAAAEDELAKRRAGKAA